WSTAMPDQEWGEKGIFDAPVARKQVEEIRIERPAEQEAIPAALPPVPDQQQDALRATLEDPRLAEELWRRVEQEKPNAPAEAPVRQDESVLAELAMSLYLLQAVHSQNSPSQEHLPRQAPPREDDREPRIRD